MKPFVYIASLVLAALLGFGLCSTFVVITDEETKATWDRERDSLTTALDTANARTMRSEGRANHIAWQLDSARKNRPTPKQVIEHNLKAMKYAPLDAVHDTLMMP